MKKLFTLFACLIVALTSFGQANTVTAKTISATTTLYVRSARIDSISSDGTFTNSRSTVLVTQSAVKAYVLPIKQRSDSIFNGLYNDTTKVQHIGATRQVYASVDGKTLIDKGWSSAIGDFYVQTKNDSSLTGVLKKVVNPGSCTNCTAQIDSNGRVVAFSTGTGGGTGGVPKKTINPQNANYTLVGADTSTYITVSRAAFDTVYVPDDGTVAMAPPVNLDVYQMGTGKVVFLPLNGSVTVSAEFGRNRTGAQYSKVTLNKLSANNWLISGQLDTAAVPFLSTNIGTLPALPATNAGTPSAADSFTVSGSALTANAIITPSSTTNFEVSLNNSAWGTSQSITQSGGILTGQPVKVYARATAGATPGSINGTININSTGASQLQLPISGTINQTTQQAYFNFAATRTTAAGSQPVYGDPTLSPAFADTVGGTMWLVSLVGANWVKYGGFYGGSGNGATAPSADGVFTQAMGASNLYTGTVFNGSNYNVVISNLPAGTYQITLWASIPYTIFQDNFNMEYWVQFGTGFNQYALPMPNNGTGSTGNLITSGPGTTNVAGASSFTGTITSGQTINICVGKGTGATFHANGPNGATVQTSANCLLGYINALLIKKIG